MDAPLLPLESGPSRTLDASERDALVERITDDKLKPLLASEGTKAEQFDLPFYGDVTLLMWTNPAWKPASGRICFLQHGDELVRLDGTSPPIHALNAKADLVISRATAMPYLAFFCYFVRGDEGPFLLLDRLENGFLPETSRTTELEEHFRSPVLWGQAPNGSWRASSLVYYSNAVFTADFSIQLTGMVEMAEDTPILTDLEGKVDSPLQVELQLAH